MTFKSNGNKRDSKKLISAFMCLIFGIIFIALIFTHGFSLSKIIFGALFIYFATALFRTSNEY